MPELRSARDVPTAGPTAISQRVLLLSEPIPPENPGGAGQYALWLAKELAATGVDTWLLSASRSTSDWVTHDLAGSRALQVASFRFPGGDWRWDNLENRQLRAEEAFVDAIGAVRPSVVHDVGSFLFGQALRQLVIRAQIPLISHALLLMGPYLEAAAVPSHYIQYFHGLQATQCAVSARVIVTSRFEVGLYNNWFSRGPRPLLLPNPVYRPMVSPEAVARWRQVLRADERIVLLTPNAGDSIKGVDRALAFTRALRERGLEATLATTGLRGWRESAMSGDSGLLDLGRVPETEYGSLLVAVSAVLCPSRYEAFGMAAAEAALCGATVLASAIGGHLDTMPALGGLLVRDEEWMSPSEKLVNAVLAPSAPARATPATTATLTYQRHAQWFRELYQAVAQSRKLSPLLGPEQARA